MRSRYTLQQLKLRVIRLGLHAVFVGLWITSLSAESQEKRINSAQSAKVNSGDSSELKLAKVEHGRLLQSVRVTGRVVPREGSFSLQSARFPGRVVGLLKRDGDYVKRGDPLLEVSATECVTLREEARIAKESNLNDMVQSVEHRRAELDLQIKGEKCMLTAAGTGTLSKRNVEIGSAFSTGDTLFQVLDTSRLTVELDIPEKDLSRIGVGSSVKFTLPSEEGASYSSKIKSIVPTLDPVTHTSKARLEMITFRHRVSLESFVSADIQTPSEVTTLLIPIASVVFVRGKFYVIKVSESKQSMVEVVVVDESSTSASVRSVKSQELRENDFVVAAGASYLAKKLLDNQL